MYAVVRCRSKAVFERLRDDLIQRGQKCHSLRIDTEHESMLDYESLLDSEIDTQELFNGETADFPEENGGVSALDLLGEAGGQEEDKEDQEFDDEMPFLEAKPRTFHTEPEIEPTKTTSTTYSINCRICTQSIRYKPETEWSQKCNHVLQHLVPVRYECPYCGQQEKIKGVLYDHLVQTHNEGIMAIPIPTVRELSEAKRFLVQLEQCFPDSEQFSLAIPDDHLTADIHDVIYYKFVLKSEMPRKYMKQAPVRLKCAKCNSCISKGPMEGQLKFEHALNHSHLTWITCSKCQATFTEKDSFFMHNRAMHHGGGFAICKERDDLSEENQIFVEHLVVKLFPTVIPTTLAERAPPPILLAKKTGPPQRKSRLRQVLPIEMENQGIVHVKQEERPSLSIFDTQEVKLENDADVTKRRSLRKRKLVAT